MIKIIHQYLEFTNIKKGTITMISKQEYIQGEVESAWEDPKFVNQVLYSWFEDNVKNLTQQEFKEYLIDLGWDIESEDQ